MNSEFAIIQINIWGLSAITSCRVSTRKGRIDYVECLAVYCTSSMLELKSRVSSAHVSFELIAGKNVLCLLTKGLGTITSIKRGNCTVLKKLKRDSNRL